MVCKHTSHDHSETLKSRLWEGYRRGDTTESPHHVKPLCIYHLATLHLILHPIAVTGTPQNMRIARCTGDRAQFNHKLKNKRNDELEQNLGLEGGGYEKLQTFQQDLALAAKNVQKAGSGEEDLHPLLHVSDLLPLPLASKHVHHPHSLYNTLPRRGTHMRFSNFESRVLHEM